MIAIVNDDNFNNLIVNNFVDIMLPLLFTLYSSLLIIDTYKKIIKNWPVSLFGLICMFIGGIWWWIHTQDGFGTFVIALLAALPAIFIIRHDIKRNDINIFRKKQ